MMIFLILFIVGGLAVPVSIDAARHKGDNIFQRSGRDLVNYELTQSALRSLRLSGSNLHSGAVSVVALSSGVGLLWLFFWLLRVLF